MELPQHWPLPHATGLRSDLLAAYSDPGRHYHDSRHLTEVLTRLEELATAGEDFERIPVVLAAWFHDSVYDGERDAEERSAAWAEDSLPEFCEPDLVAEVARLVRLTELHAAADDDANGRALSDADLAILAADAERYDEYARAVRHEYAHIGDEEFRVGRAAVLQRLLDKESLFHTAYATAHWESAARANMQRELTSLTAVPA